MRELLRGVHKNGEVKIVEYSSGHVILSLSHFLSSWLLPRALEVVEEQHEQQQQQQQHERSGRSGFLVVKMKTSKIELPGAVEVLQDPRANMSYFGATRAMERLLAESCAGEVTAGAELLARHRCSSGSSFLSLKRPEYDEVSSSFLRMLAERHPDAMKVFCQNSLLGARDEAPYNSARWWGLLR
jgi:hypothetical protein